MAKPKKTPPSRKGGKYSFGSIALTLILVLLYWWSNGAQPEGSTATTPAATTAAVTALILPTSEPTAIVEAVDEAAVDEAAVDEAATAEPTDAIPTVDEPTDEPTEPPAATMVQATATALPSKSTLAVVALRVLYQVNLAAMRRRWSRARRVGI